ncbi:hypothetical protein [Cysteiniphilum litorale]|uniref:hypothetical protein n=1 Tax=Cysteiniphilum litorale TaxID=2056700 RepID=UPI003F881065
MKKKQSTKNNKKPNKLNKRAKFLLMKESRDRRAARIIYNAKGLPLKEVMPKGDENELE